MGIVSQDFANCPKTNKQYGELVDFLGATPRGGVGQGQAASPSYFVVLGDNHVGCLA
jgi:hypothetical protein